jgi:cytosine deaminase
MPPDLATLTSARGYRLANVTLPACLTNAEGLPAASEGLLLADIDIADGAIAAIAPPGATNARPSTVDLDRGMVLPCFADVHTHLDKGHIWPRRPNPDGTFIGALNAVLADREANWNASDVSARIDFALRCAYAHGTAAIRTHIDSRPGQTAISWPVFAQMRERWAGRIALEASPLFGIDLAADDEHMAEVTEAVARFGHVMGAVTYMGPTLRPGLDRLFRLAMDRDWDLDFHVDETMDSGAHSLRVIADMAIDLKFQGRILVGHCCSLSVQGEDEAARTLDRVAKAGISVVSLPMCNMYLQDRVAGRTPRRRGVTLLHEMKARGIDVMVASDNTRDPFYAYGDLDCLEVLREATRILHFDHPHGDWINAITGTPAAFMGSDVLLKPGAAADLVLFGARNWNELLSRPQSDRRVMRSGAIIGATVPDYRELDALAGVA